MGEDVCAAYPTINPGKVFLQQSTAPCALVPCQKHRKREKNVSTKQNAEFLVKSPSKSEFLTTARTTASQPPAWFRAESVFLGSMGTHWPLPTVGMNWGLSHKMTLPQVCH